MTERRTSLRTPGRTESQATLLPGGWRRGAPLGKGGNGTVYRATRDGQECALKILHPRFVGDAKRRARFESEIASMRACADVLGVLPLIDASVPSSGSESPWLVMPIAQPLEEALGASPALRDVVEAISQLAETLTTMHARGVSHRDIKPDNLFRFQGRWCLGDFGLALLDGQERLTALHEKLGPMFYIAPEMLNSASTADGRPADVYSLAKLLWKLASGMSFPLPGHHLSHLPVFSLNTYTTAAGAGLLNSIIESATNAEPGARLSMAEIASSLQAWLRPRSATVNQKIPLDLGAHLTLVAEAVAAREAQARLYSESSERRLVANRHWVSKLNEFIADVRASMIEAGLTDTKIITHADELNCNTAIQYGLARGDGGRGDLYITLSHQPGDLPRCKFVGSIHANYMGALLGHNMQPHTVEYEYLSEGPDAEHAFEVGKHAITHALNGRLQEFIEVVTKG